MNIRFIVAMLSMALLSLMVVSCAPKTERVNGASATSTAMITPEEASPAREIPPVREEPSVESSPDGVYNEQNEYSKEAYADFLEAINGVIKKAVDKTNEEYPEGRKLTTKDAYFVWGEEGKYDTLVLKVTEFPMSKEYCVNFGGVISDIYHMKFPDNVSLKFIIKDSYMKKPIYQNVYSWGASA